MEKFSVKKPFTVLVMVIVILILGVVSLTSMTTDLLPRINLPYMLVTTTYPGASPEKVETQICEPMESALGTINGVKNIYSMSYENYGIVQLEFLDSVDMDSAMVKVSSALDTIEAVLPEECGTPSIMELSTDMMASVYLAASYDGMTIEETSRFVEDTLIPRLERQDGVTNITSIGLVEDSIQVELNKEKIDALNDKILAKANDSFAEAVEQLDDAKKKLLESEEQLVDSKQELQDGEKELEENKQKLIDSQKELDDGRAELYDNQATLNQSKEDLEKGKEELNNKKKETINQLATASEALDQLSTYQAQLVSQQADLQAAEGAIKELPNAIAQLNQGLDSLSAGIDGIKSLLITDDSVFQAEDELSPEHQYIAASLPLIYQNLFKESLSLPSSGITYRDVQHAVGSIVATYEEMVKQKEQLKAQYDSYSATKETLSLQIEVTKGIIAKYEEELKAMNVNYQDIEKAKMEAAAGFGSADAQMVAGESALNSAQVQLDSAFDSLKDAQEQIDTGWESMEDAQKQMEDGWKSIADAEEQMKDGWSDYEDAVENYEKQKTEALRNANANQLVNMDTLAQLIYAQNFAMPAGYVDDQFDNSWLVKVGTSFSDLSELENIVLTNIEDIGDVRLCDVADITLINNAGDSYARLNGDNAIILSIFKSSTTGTNEVSKNIQKAVLELEEEYTGLSILTLMDQGDYITMIINGVLQSMIIGAVLAIVILAMFLKDVKPTLVVAVSIPLSVLTALVLMYFTDISLNMMSLSGLALGIGMLVDNSIVVIENIYRLRAKGVSAARAAVQGTRQVSGAILASTLTTVSVFAPMIFTTGMVRDLMMPISMTIIYTLMASLLIAMTVVPATGSTLLKNTRNKPHPFFDKIQDAYGVALEYCLKIKIIPLAIAIGMLVFSIWQVVRMGIVMLPEMTSNQIQVSVQMPEETDKETCYQRADEVLDAIMQVEGIASVGAMAGGDTALLAAGGETAFDSYSFMISTENEKAGAEEVKTICADIIAATEHIDCEVSISTGMDEMSALTGSGLTINIYGDDLVKLQKIADDLVTMAESVEGYTDITDGQEDADQVIHLVLDKDAAMRQGLTVTQIFSDINTKLSESKTAATVTFHDVDMDIIIKDTRDPLTKENLLDYNFEVSKTDEDNFTYTEDHPLSEFASIDMEDGYTAINRENQSRYMTVSASVEEGYNATLLARELQPMLDAYEAPAGYTIEMSGESDSVNEMVFQMGKVLLMGLAFIYLVMVAQFQSLLSPFIVLFTVPLAFTGGLLGLLFMREPLSVMGMMGFIVLLGTVVNNGIVFVDYANQLRIGGLERRDALIATGKARMRPILMTALTTILAMVSLLFGDDLSSQMSKGMAIVVAGGLLYATLMTLFIIPVMYDILFKRKPIQVDLGSENLDDVPDDAADYLAQKALADGSEKENKSPKKRVRRLKRKK